MRVLAVDIGGTSVKILATGQTKRRKTPSGRKLTAKLMVKKVLELSKDWGYDAVSIGFPGPIVHDRPVVEPAHLGAGWVGFDYEAAFGHPVKMMNDAAMQALGSYEGRLYILQDRQIERYDPRGHTYPDVPSRYFVSPPPKPLETAVDMTIDGHVYILYQDGTILKFLRGESVPFDLQGVPGDLRQATALAVNPDGDSGSLYVADSGNRRVVVLRPDGSFQSQWHAEGAFDAIEALTVSEATSQLHVISNGTLYVATMPQ